MVSAGVAASTILLAQTGCGQTEPNEANNYDDLQSIQRQFESEGQSFKEELPKGYRYPDSIYDSDSADFQNQLSDGGTVSVEDGYFYTQKIIYWNCAWIESAVDTEGSQDSGAQYALDRALEIESIDNPRFGLDNAEELADDVIRPISNGDTGNAIEYVQSCDLKRVGQ